MSEVSQPEKDKYHDNTYMLDLIHGTKHTYEKNRNKLTDVEKQRAVVPEAEVGREGWIGSLGQQMQAITYRMKKQQGPTVQQQ